MADRININYNNKNYDVYTTKELKKELEKIFYNNYEISVKPYYNSKMTEKDWREFSRIRDIVGKERIKNKYRVRPNHYNIVNPERERNII